MKEQRDEILKQYGVSGCTDFSFPLKSEHPITSKPPTHPNPNIVRICKSVRNIGRSLTRTKCFIVTYHANAWQRYAPNLVIEMYPRFSLKPQHFK